MEFSRSLAFLAILLLSSNIDSASSFCDTEFPGGIYLDLSNVGIKSLQPSFVSSGSITCLNLGYNHMSSMDENAFVGLPNLTALNLTGNTIEFETFHAYNFAKLKTLILDEAFVTSEISRFYPPTHGYDRIRRLQDKLSREMVANMSFPLLEELSMCNYRTSEMLVWLERFDVPNLQRLRLNGNEITDDNDLPSNIVNNLTDLHLNDNQISSFSGMKLTKLRHLSMNNNKIQRLCAVYCNINSMTPQAMLHLESLSMVGNEISNIDADAFANSAHLLSLNLAKNSIENFPKHAFDNMTKLQYLTLDDNNFEQIPDICALINLRELSIDGNAITSINAGSFCDLPKLARVSLKRNGLTSVTTGTFGSLPMLKALDMSWNNIVRLPKNWIKSGFQIEEIKLDGNKFTDVSDMSLEQFKDLVYLSIGNNPLKTINIGSLINLPVNTTLDVGYVCENQSVLTSNDAETNSPSLRFARFRG